MNDSTDDALLADLRHIAAEIDPVPGDVTAAARAAITTRDLDRELAVLIGDSSASEPAYGAAEASATRGFEPVRAGNSDAPTARLLSFEGGGVQIDVEVTWERDELTLMGQFTGAEADGCALEYGDGQQHSVELDPVGRFLVSTAWRGPARLRCRAITGGRVVTDWVVL
jgi:hypothetical protein